MEDWFKKWQDSMEKFKLSIEENEKNIEIAKKYIDNQIKELKEINDELQRRLKGGEGKK